MMQPRTRWETRGRSWRRRWSSASTSRKSSRLTSLTQSSLARSTSFLPGATRFGVASLTFGLLSSLLFAQRLIFKNLKEDADQNTLSAAERSKVRYPECVYRIQNLRRSKTENVKRASFVRYGRLTLSLRIQSIEMDWWTTDERQDLFWGWTILTKQNIECNFPSSAGTAQSQLRQMSWLTTHSWAVEQKIQ